VTPVPTPRWLAEKARDLLHLERELARAGELTRGERLRLAGDRYAAILRDARAVPYLGRTFHYDSRLMPALMPGYLTEIRRLDRIVRLDGSSVLDVGANVGQFAATVMWRFPSARVWSFEPNRAIYPLLERNAAQSRGWSTVPWGISDRDQDTTFWAVAGKSAQGSVFRENATAGLRATEPESQTVSLRRLSPETMTGNGIPSRVDLVKVDVEGAEAQALRGLAGIRWRYLAIETSTGREGGMTVAQALELVQEIWRARATVVWRDQPKPGATALDAILALA
jgi:FkbM family methyltransferase